MNRWFKASEMRADEAHEAEEHPEEHFEMPARNVYPHPASQHSMLFTSVIVIAAAVAVILIAITTTDTSNSLRHLISQQNTKGALRDKQHTDTENQIKNLETRLATTQTKTNGAICTLVIAVVAQDKSQGRPLTPFVLEFANSLNCKIPPNLLH